MTGQHSRNAAGNKKEKDEVTERGGGHHQIKLWRIQFSKLSNPKAKQVYKGKKHYLAFELLLELVCELMSANDYWVQNSRANL